MTEETFQKKHPALFTAVLSITQISPACYNYGYDKTVYGSRGEIV